MPLPTSFTAHASTLLARVACGTSNIELVHAPHDQWPFPRTPTITKDKLRISVLDSSFNPPTLAHLALAKAPAPPLCSGGAIGEIKDESSGYDAHLLLLSIRNADKPLKPGDATHLQRLEMMYFFAQDIIQPVSQSPTSTCHVGAEPNIAIAIINAPLFVDKSTVLRHFLRHRLSALVSPNPFHNNNIRDNNLDIPQIIPEPRLTFLLGFDTLERLFSPRCYLDRTEEPMLDALRHFFDEGSTFVCAKRDPSSYPSFDTPPPTQSPADLSRVGLKATAAGDQEWSALIPSAAQEFISAKQITLIDIGAEEQTISSSNVRSLRLRTEDGGRWKNLIGLGVGGYIQEKGLYLPSISASMIEVN